MNQGFPGPSGGGGMRAKALPLLAIGVVFAVVGAVMLATGSGGAGAWILVGLGVADAAVSGALLLLDATYGRRFRK